MRDPQPTPAGAGTPDAPDATVAAPVSRRSLLAYAVSAPVLTVAAGFGANLAVPSTAEAALPLTPPDTVDFYDIGDSLVQTALPTMPLVKLQIGTDGRVTARPAAAGVGPGHRHRLRHDGRRGAGRAAGPRWT